MLPYYFSTFFENYLGVFLCVQIYIHMETKKTPNNLRFFCEKCDFTTDNRKDFKRHLLTPKHNLGVIVPKKPLFHCKNCEKKYTSRSGLYKHSNKCFGGSEGYTEKWVQTENIEDCAQNMDDNFLKNNEENENIRKINDQKNENDRKINNQKNEENDRKIKNENNENNEKNENNENKQIYSLIMKQGEILESLLKQIGVSPNSNTIHNTTNNNNNSTNQINLHLYLNETCKDAGNLPEFIEKIGIQLSDLISVKNKGLLNSTKNIILKELQNTEQIKRPIQCTDIKRKTLYVKEEGSWSKDVGNEKLKGAIHAISQKHMPFVKDWKDDNNEALDNDEYVHVVKNATTDVLEETRGIQSALKEICQETYMKGGME